MDEVREKIKKLGSVQRKIILWLGNEQRATTPHELKDRWPSEEAVPVNTPFGKALQDIAKLRAIAGSTIRAPTKYAPYLEDSYFFGSTKLLEQGWVAWNPEEVLGHIPSPAESASISKGIRGLEERGLVEVEKVAGKKRRISHVKLTFHGEVASVLLRV